MAPLTLVLNDEMSYITTLQDGLILLLTGFVMLDEALVIRTDVDCLVDMIATPREILGDAPREARYPGRKRRQGLTPPHYQSHSGIPLFLSAKLRTALLKLLVGETTASPPAI